MLKINAAEFAAVADDLERMLTTAHFQTHTPRSRGVAEPTIEIAIALTDAEKTDFIQVLDATADHCEAMKLAHTRDIALYYTEIYEKSVVKWQDVRNDAHAVLLSLYAELNRQTFLQLDSSQAQLFAQDENKKHFGDAVATAFPSAESDIHEAGNCLALERWPASVFHCMRTLEIGLNALATKFGATSINWHNIIEECEAKIKKIDSTWGADWKDQQKFYSEAARHFMFLKDALRNHIMHVRDVFDEGKALSIWQHTKEFMQQISKRLHE